MTDLQQKYAYAYEVGEILELRETYESREYYAAKLVDPPTPSYTERFVFQNENGAFYIKGSFDKETFEVFPTEVFIADVRLEAALTFNFKDGFHGKFKLKRGSGEFRFYKNGNSLFVKYDFVYLDVAYEEEVLLYGPRV